MYGGAQATAGTANYPTLLAFLQDLPTQFIANANPQPVYYRSTEAAWYVQDEVKLKPHLENNAKMLWQPRVGLAWDPTGTGKWAVRAGFGIHHDLQDNIGHRLNANPPFGARMTIQNTPLLSIIPIPFGTQPPQSCNAQSTLQPPACGIFTPGGLDPVMKTPTLEEWSLTVERG